MATFKEDKHIRLVYCIVNGCTKAAKALVLHYIQLAKPSDVPEEDWTLDAFLYKHSDNRILVRLEKHTRDVLYPGYRKETNIDHWDLSLLFTVLEVCPIDSNVKNNIFHIRKCRNKLFHMGSTVMTDEKFSYYKQKIEGYIRHCCMVLKNDGLDKEVSETFKEADNKELSDQSTETLQKDFDEWCKTDSILDKLNTLSKGQIEIMTKLDELMTLVESIKSILLPASHLERQHTDPSFLGTGKFQSMKRTKGNNSSTRTRRVVPLCTALLLNDSVHLHKKLSSNGYKYKMDPNVGIQVKNCAKQKASSVSDTLYKHLSCNVTTEEANTELGQAISEAKDQLLAEDRVLLNTRKGCVILKVQCPTFDSLKSLIIDCVDGKLGRGWRNVERILRQQYDTEELTLEIMITNFEFWRCVEQIVNGLTTVMYSEIGISNSSQFKAEVQTSPPVPVIDNQGLETGASMITLAVKPRTYTQCISARDAIESGKFDEKLRNVTKLMMEVYDLTDLSITSCMEGFEDIDDIIRRTSWKGENLEEHEEPDKFRMAKGSETLLDGSDEIFPACDVCRTQDTSIISKALSYCTICCEYLCRSCDRAHKGSSASRDHPILPETKMLFESSSKRQTKPIMFCDIHKTNTLDKYCKHHDVVMCSICTLISHTSCETVAVSHQANLTNVTEHLSTIITGFSDLGNEVDTLKKARETDKSSVKTQIQNCYHKLLQLRSNVDDTLARFVEKTTVGIANLEKEKIKVIDKHMNTADDLLSQISAQEKYLHQCQKVQENDVMFVGMQKASMRKREYEDILASMQREIYPIDICFRVNDTFTDLMLQLESLGSVVDQHVKHDDPIPDSVLNMSIGDAERKNIGSKILGCTFMSDGHLLLGCGNDGLKLVDKNFLFKSDIKDHSHDVSAVDDTDVIVTQSMKKQLLHVQVLPGMKVRRTLKMARPCEGVDVCRGEIYVTCHDNPGNGEVQVLNMYGTLQRRLGKNKGKYMFKKPYYVKVSRDASQIFVSDMSTDTVTCLNQQNQVMYTYSDRDLKSPAGMYVDGRDNLLVCGFDSNNVHMVVQDGRKRVILFAENAWIQHNNCVSYRDSDGYLAVGLDTKCLILFRTR